MMGSESRQKTGQIKVRVSQEEKQWIKQMALGAGMNTSGFLRELGLSHQLSSKVDPGAIEELCKLHSRLNLIGDQLKIWIIQQKATEKRPNAQALINELEALKREIQCQVKVLP